MDFALWKIPILCVIAINNGARYSFLVKKVQGITDTMLSASLKELERSNLISRVQYNEMPIRVEYFLTEKSKAIIPLLKQIALWEKKFR